MFLLLYRAILSILALKSPKKFTLKSSAPNSCLSIHSCKTLEKTFIHKIYSSGSTLNSPCLIMDIFHKHGSRTLFEINMATL